MTEQQIIETLATKLMGWTLGNNYFVGSQRHECFNLPNGGRLLRTHWNPLQNIADAWMIVDRFKNEQDAILRYTFESHIPPLICAIEPHNICRAAIKTIEEVGDRS